MLVLGGALVPFIAPGLERKLGGPAMLSPFMLLMLANLAVTLPLSVFPTILDGLQRFGAKSAVRLVFLGAPRRRNRLCDGDRAGLVVARGRVHRRRTCSNTR